MHLPASTHSHPPTPCQKKRTHLHTPTYTHPKTGHTHPHVAKKKVIPTHTHPQPAKKRSYSPAPSQKMVTSTNTSLKERIHVSNTQYIHEKYSLFPILAGSSVLKKIDLLNFWLLLKRRLNLLFVCLFSTIS